MAEPLRGFAVAEFEARTARAQAGMAERGIAGLLLMTEPEVRYFTGFLTPFWQSPTRPWFLFVPVSGKPIAVIPEIGAVLMRKTWVEDIRTWSAPNPADDGIGLLTELLAPLAAKGARIGMMMGHETSLRMPLGDYERLRAGLTGLEIMDATGLVQGLRMVKSDAEIAKIHYICEVASRSFARVPELVAEGQPFEDVFRAFRCEALRQGADEVPYLVGGADQGGYHDVISPPSRRPLQAGDIFMLDTGMTWDGYFCDFDRSYGMRQADDASCRAYEALWCATEAGLAAARPGATCRDVFAAMQAVLAKAGGQGGDVGRLGHGLGIQLTEVPSIAAFDDTVLKENMVLTLEPSIDYGDGRLMVQEENIVIRAQGAELLTVRAPEQLPVIGGAG